MITAIKIVAPAWYTPASEEGKEKPTRFKLRGLTGMEMMEVFEGYRSLPGGEVAVGAPAYRAALRCGMTGWENVTDENGPVKFERVMDDNISRLSFNLIFELFGEIMARTELTEEESKK